MPENLAKAMESEWDLRFKEAERSALEKGAALNALQRKAIEQKGPAARLVRDNTIFNPKGTGNARRRKGDKTYAQGFRDISIAKGLALEEGVTSVLRSSFSDIDNQTVIDLGKKQITRSDVIARNAANDGMICGIKVKKGESIGAEIKCGSKYYLYSQIDHIDKQLSGYGKLPEPVDHKIVMVTADIERLTQDALIVDDNGKVTLSPNAPKDCAAAKFMMVAAKHNAVVYEMPFYADDMTYSYIYSLSYLEKQQTNKIKKKEDHMLGTKEYQSKIMPELEVTVSWTGKGKIVYDGLTLGEIDARKGIIQLDDKPPIKFKRQSTIDGSVGVAMKVIEKKLSYRLEEKKRVSNEELEEAFKDSKLIESLDQNIRDRDVTTFIPESPSAKTNVYFSEEGYRELYERSLMPITNRSYDDIKNSGYIMQVSLNSFFQGDSAYLTVKLIDGTDREPPISADLMLPKSMQSRFNTILKVNCKSEDPQWTKPKKQDENNRLIVFQNFEISEDGMMIDAMLVLDRETYRNAVAMSDASYFFKAKNMNPFLYDRRQEAHIEVSLHDVRLTVRDTLLNESAVVPITEAEKQDLLHLVEKKMSMYREEALWKAVDAEKGDKKPKQHTKQPTRQ